MAFIGNIGNGLGNMLRARQKQAELNVHAYLSTLDDATLNRAGVSRDQLKVGGQANFFL